MQVQEKWLSCLHLLNLWLIRSLWVSSASEGCMLDMCRSTMLKAASACCILDAMILRAYPSSFLHVSPSTLFSCSQAMQLLSSGSTPLILRCARGTQQLCVTRDSAWCAHSPFVCYCTANTFPAAQGKQWKDRASLSKDSDQRTNVAGQNEQLHETKGK